MAKPDGDTFDRVAVAAWGAMVGLRVRRDLRATTREERTSLD